MKYIISLNPKKTIFRAEEGKMLGHNISKYGINIDREIVKAISHLPLPHNNKVMQSFFVRINFVRNFTPDFIEICSEFVGRTTMLLTACRRRFRSITRSIFMTKKPEKNIKRRAFIK
jgi:hypothetical protein